MSKILLVEDDVRVVSMVKDWLEHEFHTVDSTTSGSDADLLLSDFEYDLLILDWELPDVSGIEVLRRFRTRGGKCPVLMLTGKVDIRDKEMCFNLGVDDYLTKPFDCRELSFRLRALLRRAAQSVPDDVLSCDYVVLDRRNRHVTALGTEVQLTPKEYGILELLMKYPGQIFSVDTVLRRVWSSESDATDLAVRTVITRLRKKLKVKGKAEILRTIHGAGYRVSSQSE